MPIVFQAVKVVPTNFLNPVIGNRLLAQDFGPKDFLGAIKMLAFGNQFDDFYRQATLFQDLAHGSLLKTLAIFNAPAWQGPKLASFVALIHHQDAVLL